MMIRIGLFSRIHVWHAYKKSPIFVEVQDAEDYGAIDCEAVYYSASTAAKKVLNLALLLPRLGGSNADLPKASEPPQGEPTRCRRTTPPPASSGASTGERERAKPSGIRKHSAHHKVIHNGFQSRNPD